MHYSRGNATDSLIIFCESLVVIPLSILVSKNMSTMNADIKRNLSEIEKNNEVQQEMINDIMSVTKNVTSEFDKLNVVVNECNESTIVLNEAVSEISLGSLETTKEIEGQSIAIDEIKNVMEEIVVSNN